MTDDLNTPHPTDQALFWPTFLVFAALLIGTYVITAPPGGNVIQALIAGPGPSTVVGALKSALPGA
ncbi:hypothetical protein JQ557_15185 [Bradyrhizobium sp. U87765 SZCCT0131]|uniref:hypothetical protein n=1 Tax=unclassified Bradyrhizobium TaxID=2631580 RepID=UPI001BA68E6C|nr:MULTISPECIES: hypothetical protein [unclassified Bradyrhizobium]MBR1219345.1 hypothetical protein [Bradyrhizobium sp. U87765 SZCCT0131]MBR1261996.1 hypothetical protein [Bradyrhizobium sp. U87765 SZCCT0134]MBR1306151.1 hypothetical protein [Bradyrhizobium sp. U87765 SZCCT0110]MBR1317778.1 hypothetical protein [Bradyrhizobium sp. U87765 SZCCT0109]MBR1351480.1 hypothetical protein [Bradyrhizobium sp. U87765 SZCCT0048]